MYEIRLLDAAKKRFNKIAKVTLIKRIKWLAENLDDVALEPLKGDLSEFYKL